MSEISKLIKFNHHQSSSTIVNQMMSACLLCWFLSFFLKGEIKEIATIKVELLLLDLIQKLEPWIQRVYEGLVKMVSFFRIPR